MKQYLITGFMMSHSPGEFVPFKGLAVLKPDEVMDHSTLSKVEAILLAERNKRCEGAVAKSVQITSFQPYETRTVAQPAAEPHLNECSVVLPPVDSPLLIEIAPGVLVRATRPAHAESKLSQLAFDLENGRYYGRPRWTHP